MKRRKERTLYLYCWLVNKARLKLKGQSREEKREKRIRGERSVVLGSYILKKKKHQNLSKKEKGHVGYGEWTGRILFAFFALLFGFFFFFFVGVLFEMCSFDLDLYGYNCIFGFLKILHLKNLRIWLI